MDFNTIDHGSSLEQWMAVGWEFVVIVAINRNLVIAMKECQLIL
jgi:hypothetical protein